MINETGLMCRKCGLFKSISNFYKQNSARRGYRTRCKSCIKPQAHEINKKNYLARKSNGYYDKFDRIDRKRRELKAKYGITLEEYHTILNNQEGKCAICLGEIKVKYKDKKETFFCVDHDHVTGYVRGLLCVQCNAALGQFKENVENLERAIKYLKKYKGELQ